MSSDFPLNLDVSRNIKTVCHHLTHNMSLPEQTLTKEVCSDFGVGQINGCLIFSKLVLNQLLENSRLIDNRLNEEDFPLPTGPKVSCIYKQENGNNTNANGIMCAKADKVEDGSEDLPLLDIPFMLVSFLLSQVS